MHKHSDICMICKILTGSKIKLALFKDELQTKLDEHEIWLKNKLDKDATQAKFNGMELKRHGFQNAKLSKAEFIKCNLSGSDFKNADLTDAKFNDSNLEYCNFTNAKLTGADLTGTYLKDAIISQEQLDSAKNSQQEKGQQGQSTGDAISDLQIGLIEKKYGLKYNNGVFNCDTTFIVPRDLVTNGTLIIKFGHIKVDFDCTNNKLTSLKGAPRSVSRHFDCSENKLTTLQGAPNSVGGSFWCNNNKLITLQGASSSVGNRFDCSHNNLTTLQGAPSSTGDDFNCEHNSKKFTEQDVKSVCNVGGDIVS